MGGGGGTQTQSQTRNFPPELRGAFSAFGNTATDILQTIGPSMAEFFGDQTPQQIAGPSGLESEAYRTQRGMLHSQGPEAWSQALGMYGALGNLPQWQGADLSGISGWGLPGGGQYAGGGGGSVPGGVGKGKQSSYYWPEAAELAARNNIPGFTAPSVESAENAARGAAMGLDPSQPGSSARGPAGTDPQLGAIDPRWTQASPHQGISAPGMGQAGGTGTVREVVPVDYGGMISGGPGGGGRGGFSFSSGGGGDVASVDRIDSVLDKIDFANHPALQSALDTFAKTALPGIENSMIGAGLGRSGAAGNAIATGKAQIALPVMQQLISGELEQRGQDVTQRGQDVQANIAAAQAAASARAQGASLAQQRYMADLAHQQAMRAQDITLRGQDIGLRQQDINALLSNAGMALDARGQDINALLSGAGGLANLGQMDIDRINQNVQGSMGVGGTFRDIQNQINESEFNAANRPFERFMQLAGIVAPGAMETGGTTTVSRGGGK